MAQNNEMSLKLEIPVEKLAAEMINWNYSEIKQAVNERLKEYSCKVYGDEDVAEAKKDKALLNKFVKSINDERLNIKKVYCKPLDAFTDQVNDIINDIRQVTAMIDERVTEYDNSKREEKQAAIQAAFDELAKDKDYIVLSKIQPTSWLNASKSIASIKREIAEDISCIDNEINAINMLPFEKEQKETVLSAYLENYSFADALREQKRIEERVKFMHEKMQNSIIVDAEKPKQEQPEKSPEQPAQSEAENSAEEIFSIVFKVEATKAQLKELATFMRDKGIKYTKAN